MSAEPMNFFTPVVGRLTHGSVTEKRTRDNDNREIPVEDQRYEIGVAFQKNDIWPWMSGELYQYLSGALSQDPNALQRMQNWFQTMTGFSMKITDGDRPNSKGQVNENTKGCFVFWFNAIEFRAVAGQSADALVEIDPSEVKRGYYVQIAGTIKPNGQPGDRAGIYMNGHTVWLRAVGEVISGGMDPVAAFSGASAAAIPSGAQAYDASNGAGASFGGMPGTNPTQPPAGAPAPQPTGHAAPPAPAGMPGTAPQPTVSPGDAPQTTPHTGILSGPPGMPPR